MTTRLRSESGTRGLNLTDLDCVCCNPGIVRSTGCCIPRTSETCCRRCIIGKLPIPCLGIYTLFSAESTTSIAEVCRHGAISQLITAYHAGSDSLSVDPRRSAICTGAPTFQLLGQARMLLTRRTYRVRDADTKSEHRGLLLLGTHPLQSPHLPACRSQQETKPQLISSSGASV